MKDHEFFASEWIASWNNHDLDSILSHYADRLEFQSPFIPLLNFNNEGVIRTKEDLKKYFEIGLATYPQLNFKLLTILSGINSLVIYYESVNNKMAAEVFFLNPQGKATKVFCHYL